MRDTKGVGGRTEGIILAHILKLGKVVLLPFGNNQSYDLVVDDGGTLERVQCKTARLRQGRVEFDTCSRSTVNGVRRSYHGRADVFMAYCPDNDEVYRIAVAVCGKRMVSLRVDPPRGGPSGAIRWAKDYRY